MNTFGQCFRITIRGGSHTPEIGIAIDGMPAGISVGEDTFSSDLDRRRPAGTGATPRKESDIPHIEGLCNGLTTGGRVDISFHNANVRRTDYERFVTQPRPSHADLTQRRKYSNQYDISGGGMSSGRMTVALVAAGTLAKQIIPWAVFSTRTVSIGRQSAPTLFDNEIEQAAREGDSVGGIIECRITGVPASLGEPFFDSAESVMSHLVFSIPGVKGIEFGDGFDGTRKRGSERNDIIIDDSGHTATNNEGGINGGITNGNDIVFRVAIKPTASIAVEQTTYDFAQKSMIPLAIGGRHDACIARRASVVIEAAAAIALADLWMIHNNIK